MTAVERLALVVNAGGSSRRMGRSKALLPTPPHNRPLVLHVVERLAALVSDQIVVVSNDSMLAQIAYDFEAVRVVQDRWPCGGALGGIATGLSYCHGWAMVVACDMPNVDTEIFGHMLQFVDVQSHFDAVVPMVSGYAQPFHALWHRRSLRVMEEQLEAGALAVKETMARLHLLELDEAALGIESDSIAFLNVNTPQEWDEWLSSWGKQNGPAA